jgi:hypothetical protein
LSDDGSKTFAVQGNLQSAHGLDRKIADLQTTDALNTPLTQSSNAWTQHAAQSELAASQQRTQAQTQTDAQQSQQQAAPSMRMG